MAAPAIDVNKANKEGWTAITEAACSGHSEVVRALLAAPGIDINKRVTDGPDKGKTALGLAIAYKNREAAALLRVVEEEEEAAPAVAPAAAREALEGTGRRIYDLAEAGDVAALRPLVQQWSGHDLLNWANPAFDGWTPLQICSTEGKLEAVELLLATPGKARSCPY